MVAFGSGIDQFLPLQLCNIPELQRRATVVEDLAMLKPPIECVVREYLTGTGYKDYRKTGEVCGHVLPEGLPEGAKLPKPIATPTTKAEKGHDEPRNYLEVRAQYGEELEETELAIFDALSGRSLRKKVIVPDSKFEFGRRKRKIPRTESRLILADEVWTPDSSRFWDEAEYKGCFPRKAPGLNGQTATAQRGQEARHRQPRSQESGASRDGQGNPLPA